MYSVTGCRGFGIAPKRKRVRRKASVLVWRFGCKTVKCRILGKQDRQDAVARAIRWQGGRKRIRLGEYLAAKGQKYAIIGMRTDMAGAIPAGFRTDAAVLFLWAGANKEKELLRTKRI